MMQILRIIFPHSVKMALKSLYKSTLLYGVLSSVLLWYAFFFFFGLKKRKFVRSMDCIQGNYRLGWEEPLTWSQRFIRFQNKGNFSNSSLTSTIREESTPSIWSKFDQTILWNHFSEFCLLHPLAFLSVKNCENTPGTELHFERSFISASKIQQTF